MISLKQKKHAFTLAEVIIVCSLFAVMVIGIIFAINKSFVYLDSTRLSVIATNLAREGVEMVYNRRDSNRRKYSGDKDKHRLDTGTGSSSLGVGTYAIKEGVENGNSFIYLEALDSISDPNINPYELKDFFSAAYSNQREASKIILTGDYSYYSGGTLHTGGKIADLLKVNGQDFYRVVRVYGVYNKRSGCPNSKPEECPKEMRFCVKVFYTASLGGQHAKELCSIMTNFQE